MTREILTKNVPLGQVALLILFSLPSVIAMSAPFACLVGTLMTVGRLTSDNEILVMLSSGFSYLIVFSPAVVVGIVISIFSFIANDVLLPAGTIQFTRLWRRILVTTPALELEANSVKKFKDTVIVTGNVRHNTIDNLMILDRTSDGERRVIMASRAELLDSGDSGLILDLANAFIQSTKEYARDDYDYALADRMRYYVPQEDLIQMVYSVSPREMSSKDVYKEIKEMRVDVQKRYTDVQNRLIIHALAYENTLRAGPRTDTWNQRTTLLTRFTREKNVLENIKKDRNLSIFLLEFFKKFSIPFGAFTFVFLSVSIGLMTKKNGQAVGFIIGLLIAVVYWALLLGGQTMGIRLGTSPFWSIWTPNILMLSIGIILTLIKVRK